MPSSCKPLDPDFSALIERAKASQLPRPSERRRIREQARLTYRDVGQALNVDPMTVFRWEKGTVTPRPHHAIAYGRLLGEIEEALR